MQVIAPGKTPRGPSDRVKTDRKDAELLARLLLAGSLTRVVVPPPEVEAARELTRAHDACRRDLMNARHRVSQDAAASRPGLSQVVDVDGRASPLAVAPAVRRAGQRAGLRRPDRRRRRADRAQDGDRAGGSRELATDERWWPTVARLRAFRGDRHADRVVDPSRARRRLEALRERPGALGVARADAVAEPVRRVLARRARSPRPGRRSPAGCWSNRPGTTPATAGSARRCPTAKPASPTTSWRSPTAPSTACTASTSA